MNYLSPNPGGLLAPYWQAAAQHRLALPYCEACDRWQWPLRAACLHCGQAAVWRTASGAGRLSSWSVVHRAPRPDLQQDAPYVVAFADMDEGVRLFARLVDTPADQLRAGLRLRCRFEPSSDPQIRVPVFVVVED